MTGPLPGEQRNRLAELVEQARSDDYHGWYIAEKLAELSGAEIAPVDARFIAAASPAVVAALLAEAGHAAELREQIRELHSECATAVRQRDAETVRANVMEHERDFEQQVVVPSAWDKIEELTDALRAVEAVPCEHGYSDDERDNCGCGSCFARGVARSALAAVAEGRDER